MSGIFHYIQSFVIVKCFRRNSLYFQEIFSEALKNTKGECYLTDFGKSVKVALVNREWTQSRLVEEVEKKTGLYFDLSYLNKIMTGKNSNPKLVSAIKETLGI